MKKINSKSFFVICPANAHIFYKIDNEKNIQSHIEGFLIYIVSFFK